VKKAILTSIACLLVHALANAVAADPGRTTPKVKLNVAKQELHPDYCWFHPRVAAVPGAGRDGAPAVIMTVQKHLKVSDYYSGFWTMRTDDLGKTWTGPTEIPELAWVREPGGVVIAVADVTTSRDGLRYEPIKPWTFDDGQDLGSYNTQQHWVSHAGGLYLSYTRRGADNDHIFRHRAPLFLARVDAKRLCVLRETEQILIPERGAQMGNFGAAAVSTNESWVTVAEYMKRNEPHPRGADGSTFVARVIWPKTR